MAHIWPMYDLYSPYRWPYMAILSVFLYGASYPAGVFEHAHMTSSSPWYLTLICGNCKVIVQGIQYEMYRVVMHTRRKPIFSYFLVFLDQFLGLDGPHLALLGPLLALPASGLTPSTRGNPVSTRSNKKNSTRKYSAIVFGHSTP